MDNFLNVLWGSLDIENQLNDDQKEFYTSHKKFCIFRLNYPEPEQSVLVSFDEEVLKTSYFIRSFKRQFKITFQKGFYDFMHKKQVKMVILDNYDIFITTNLELDAIPDPLMMELQYFFNKAKLEFKDGIMQSNLKKAYGRYFKPELFDIILTYAFPFRTFKDPYLNDDFFIKVFHNFLFIRIIVKSLNLSIFPEQCDKVIASLALYFTYSEAFENDLQKKINPNFSFRIVKDFIDPEQFLQCYEIAHTYAYTCKCQRLIHKISKHKDFLIPAIYAEVAFTIIRKVISKIHNFKNDVLAIEAAAVSLFITTKLLKYTKFLARRKLAIKFDFKERRFNEVIEKILKVKYKDLETYSYREDPNIMKSVLIEVLDVQIYSYYIFLKIIEDLIDTIIADDEITATERQLIFLLKRINKAQSLGFNIQEHINPTIKENLILNLLIKFKRKRLSNEEMQEFGGLIHDLQVRLGFPSPNIWIKDLLDNGISFG